MRGRQLISKAVTGGWLENQEGILAKCQEWRKGQWVKWLKRHIRVIHSHHSRSWEIAPLARLPTIWRGIRTLPPGMDRVQVGAAWQRGLSHPVGKQSLLLPAEGREMRMVLSALFLVIKCFCEPLVIGHEMIKLKKPPYSFSGVVFLWHGTQSFSGSLFLVISASFSLCPPSGKSSQKS